MFFNFLWLFLIIQQRTRFTVITRQKCVKNPSIVPIRLRVSVAKHMELILKSLKDALHLLKGAI